MLIIFTAQITEKYSNVKSDRIAWVFLTNTRCNGCFEQLRILKKMNKRTKVKKVMRKMRMMTKMRMMKRIKVL